MSNRINMSKRAFVRIISYAAAIILVLAVSLANAAAKASNAEMQLQYNYLRAVEDLSLSLDNIKNSLNKGLYTNSPTMMSELSGKLWSEAATAKIALAQLPVEELNLEQTNKFLSQIGNYSKSLAKKYSAGEELTAAEKENLMSLYGFARSLSDDMWKIGQQIEDGSLSFSDVSSSASGKQSVNVTEGFTDFEEGFEGYPTLIYDGPFSDHIMEKSPLMLENQQEISAGEALRKAIKASGEHTLYQSDDENGKMPSYVFENDYATISVTKSGGFFSYMVKYRAVDDKTLTVEAALEKAREYMDSLGVDEMKDTYYEINGGIVIFNFAGFENNIVLYTDLIKIGVALDNGEIMSFDARGYITNHTQRSLAEPSLSMNEAASALSESLNMKSSALCVIPSGGQNEKYCYEFSCTDSDGAQILVYINADTGEEEEILLLQISSNGKLTV